MFRLPPRLKISADQAGIKYSLDPKIGYGKPDQNGTVTKKPQAIDPLGKYQRAGCFGGGYWTIMIWS